MDKARVKPRYQKQSMQAATTSIRLPTEIKGLLTSTSYTTSDGGSFRGTSSFSDLRSDPSDEFIPANQPSPRTSSTLSSRTLSGFEHGFNCICGIEESSISQNLSPIPSTAYSQPTTFHPQYNLEQFHPSASRVETGPAYLTTSFVHTPEVINPSKTPDIGGAWPLPLTLQSTPPREKNMMVRENDAPPWNHFRTFFTQTTAPGDFLVNGTCGTGHSCVEKS
jgi:hypothetical protein